MRSCRIGDDDDVRLRERRQVGDFACMIRTHLEHCEAMVFLDAGQHQRHADVVVEVAVSGQRRRSRSQTCRREFFQCRLAVAARHADHDGRQLLPPRGAQLAECAPGVLHRNLGNVLINEIRHDGTCGTLVTCLAEVVAAVEIRPLQRDEEFTLPQRAGIRADTVERVIGTMKCAVHGVGGSGQRRHHLSPSP